MKKGFVASVLSTQKQRQRFIWIRNIVALVCALGIYDSIGGLLGVALGLLGLIGGYLTIAPIIAFMVCLFEQMYS